MARRESRPSEPEPSASAKPTATQHRIRSNREKWLAPIRSAAVFTGIVGLLVVGGTKPGFQNDLQHVLHEASWMRAPKITWPSMDLFSQPPYEESTEPKPAQGNSPKNELDPAMAPAGTEKPVAGNDAAVSDSKSAPVEVSPTKTPEKENPTPVSAKVDAAWAKPSGASGSSERASDSQGSSKAPVAKEKTAVASRSERFYLVVGAFGDEANAKRMVESLRASGHAAQLVPTSVGTTKVAAAVANSQEEANAKRAALKASFPAVWVFQGNQ
jgi:cell division septation protein DedD